MIELKAGAKELAWVAERKAKYGGWDNWDGIAYRTMTVGEVIAKLKEFDQSIPMFATWEMQVKELRPESFGIGTSNRIDPIDCLMVDVD